jgi:hypothetical protein
MCAANCLAIRSQPRRPCPQAPRPSAVEVDALLKPLAGRAHRQTVRLARACWPPGRRLSASVWPGLCMPVQMKAQPKSRSRHKKPGEDGAVLEVRADASIQIDLDYGQALILERVNAFFGYQRGQQVARPRQTWAGDQACHQPHRRPRHRRPHQRRKRLPGKAPRRLPLLLRTQNCARRSNSSVRRCSLPIASAADPKTGLHTPL